MARFIAAPIKDILIQEDKVIVTIPKPFKPKEYTLEAWAKMNLEVGGTLPQVFIRESLIQD